MRSSSSAVACALLMSLATWWAAPPASAAPARGTTYSCGFTHDVGGYANGAWPATMGGGVETAVFHWCPSAVSSKGNVAFTADVQLDGHSYRHAFVSLKGRVTDLGAMLEGGKVNSQVRDVNDAGQVVGVVDGGSGQLNGFQWAPGSGAPTIFASRVVPRSAVNGLGQIVYSANSGVGPSPEFTLYVRTWAGTATVVDTHATSGGPYVIDVDINDSGLVVGASMAGGVWWRPGEPSLQSLALGTLTVGSPRAVNSTGSVAGAVQGTGDPPSPTPQPARWQSVSTAPSVLPWSTQGYAVATALNDRGTVVGYGERPDPNGTLVAIAQSTRGRITTLAPDSGDQMSLASGVSDAGVVVGSSVSVTGDMRTNPTLVTFTTWRS